MNNEVILEIDFEAPVEPDVCATCEDKPHCSCNTIYYAYIVLEKHSDDKDDDSYIVKESNVVDPYGNEVFSLVVYIPLLEIVADRLNTTNIK